MPRQSRQEQVADAISGFLDDSEALGPTGLRVFTNEQLNRLHQEAFDAYDRIVKNEKAKNSKSRAARKAKHKKASGISRKNK